MKMTSCSLLDLRNDNWTPRSAGACQGLGGRNALNFFDRLTAFRSYAINIGIWRIVSVFGS